MNELDTPLKKTTYRLLVSFFVEDYAGLDEPLSDDYVLGEFDNIETAVKFGNRCLDSIANTYDVSDFPRFSWTEYSKLTRIIAKWHFNANDSKSFCIMLDRVRHTTVAELEQFHLTTVELRDF